MNIYHSWVIYKNREHQHIDIPREIDNIFSKIYSFYPSIEWSTFDCQIPEECNVLGAWRHPNRKVYIFLFTNSEMEKTGSSKQYIVYMVVGEIGCETEVESISDKMNKLKRNLSLEYEQGKIQSPIAILEKTQKGKPSYFLVCLLGVYGLAAKWFSYYLKNIVLPSNLQSPFLHTILEWLLAIVNYIYIATIVIVLCVLVIILIKYLIFVFRKT